VGIELQAWEISILIWFLRNFGCLKVVLSKTNMYERVATMKYINPPASLEEGQLDFQEVGEQ
jgi:hypothetical protein